MNEQISSNEILIAVLDGCTMGTESVFASILYGKILRNIAKNHFYQEFTSNRSLDSKSLLKSCIKQLIAETKGIKNQLGLDVNELLSTLIIGIVNTKSYSAELLTIGDGAIYVDGELTEYEQDNTPDYLGYHLNEPFDTWYDSLEQRKTITKFTDLSIATDGIFTFKNLEDKTKQKSESEIVEYLLKDRTFSENANFLERKVRELSKEMKHVVTDDLAIIRIITNLQQTL
ncbi:protein phosphatase 2C domain-containing protein [Fulvivirga maritima]|nr:protein phosphatase 2C domain-containing protein [Fulvivirga maritima]